MERDNGSLPNTDRDAPEDEQDVEDVEQALKEAGLPVQRSGRKLEVDLERPSSSRS